MDLSKPVPQNYFCFFNQTSMKDHEWEVTKPDNTDISTYLSQYKSYTKTKKVLDHGKWVKKTSTYFKWETEDEGDQADTSKFFQGQDLYTGVIHQGVLIINEQATKGGDSDYEVGVNALSKGTRFRRTFEIYGVYVAIAAVVLIACCIGCCVLRHCYMKRHHDPHHYEEMHH